MDEFRVASGGLIPGEPFAAQASVLGVDVTGGLGGPVTLQIHRDGVDLEPFGSFDYDVLGDGDLNDGSNPRHEVFTLGSVYTPGTIIEMTAAQWIDDDDDSEDSFSNDSGSGDSVGGDDSSDGSGSSNSGIDWDPYQTAHAGDGSPNVLVLENGDPVPDIPGFRNNGAMRPYVRPYVDASTGLVTLGQNQAIYFFEIGTSDLGDPDADFQDLVVLVTLASDPAYFGGGGSIPTEGIAGNKVTSQWTDSANRPIAPHLYEPTGSDNAGNPYEDKAGNNGPSGCGSITSDDTFIEWYRDDVAVNQSTLHDLTLVLDPVTGVYEYLDSDFHPIDDKLFGNEGDTHNNYYTLAFSADFVYDRSAGQFFEFEGGDGAWMFLHGRLILDIGGVRPSTGQYASMDRLSLNDGSTYTVHFFFAQRDPQSTGFNLRTNIELSPGDVLGTVSRPFD
ncbi:MAG: fibro-slime domain-containing protein [Planctomycetes bacterium]|nr:fibro-slime domain-containing protein [Planctomycetota bacterium]